MSICAICGLFFDRLRAALSRRARRLEIRRAYVFGLVAAGEAGPKIRSPRLAAENARPVRMICHGATPLCRPLKRAPRLGRARIPPARSRGQRISRRLRRRWQGQKRTPLSTDGWQGVADGWSAWALAMPSISRARTLAHRRSPLLGPILRHVGRALALGAVVIVRIIARPDLQIVIHRLRDSCFSIGF